MFNKSKNKYLRLLVNSRHNINIKSYSYRTIQCLLIVSLDSYIITYKTK